MVVGCCGAGVQGVEGGEGGVGERNNLPPVSVEMRAGGCVIGVTVWGGTPLALGETMWASSVHGAPRAVSYWEGVIGRPWLRVCGRPR